MKSIKEKIIIHFIWIVYRLLFLTWRIRIVDNPKMIARLKNKQSFCIALWHGEFVAMAHIAQYYKVATILSDSRDGDLVANVITKLGGKSARGSSRKKGVKGLRQVLKLCKEGYNPTVAVDGPKGPAFEIKPGIFEISRLCKCPIYPVSYSCDSAFTFKKSWDKTRLPYPFAKINIRWGEEITPIDKAKDPRDKDLKTLLKSALDNASRQSRNDLDTSKNEM